MRIAVIIATISILSFSGCSVFHTQPQAVVDGMATLHELSVKNKHNFVEITSQYHTQIEKYVKKYAPENLRQGHIDALKEWAAEVLKANQQAQYAEDLSAALKAYLATEGADPGKILDLIQMIREFKNSDD